MGLWAWHTRNMVPTVEMRKRLEARISLVGLEGFADETRVPVAIIQAAMWGKSISNRNWEKLSNPVVQAPAQPLQPRPGVVRQETLVQQAPQPAIVRRRRG